ncbi:MAG TPA: SMP-30/gluconolactonase/LRE family protein [Acidimicrobiia bacterium]|nr:SMP-30/gluconolactonase/LRE family protein [Acidimicrobiia bacterium]
MRVERLTEPGAVLGEGPVWDSDDGTLLWVDIIGQKVHRTDPATGDTDTIETPSAVGAVAKDRSGGVIASLVDGVYRLNGPDWARLVEIEPNQATNRANESKCDPHGSYLVGTMPWTGQGPTGSLHRVHPDLTVDTLRTGLTISNGLAWIDDVMWHIDTPTRQVLGFEYHPEAPLGEVVGVIEVDPPGGPDGMCADVEGCLWVAVWGSGTVRRYATDGRLLDEIRVPASQVSSCVFGGPGLSLLFMTSATENLENPDSEPEAGAVFVTEPGVQGFAPDRFGG